ncbi:hypothetical protein JR316_0002824 [Psilocybe cubensis]|uniref:Uncharacterized protein n=1 Tax=Psilocybe cubensis TaxID=181762 RepID=A0ACB8HE63_PSICU|nr:hypothetical protein JR316_0002824 [Psilocybe cubensis]KAH9485907.1 hypothetical protein JR316_0002824 [Psilocybe cubensis]
MEPTVLYKGLLYDILSEVLKGDIDGPILFSKVLSDLAPTTNYSVTVDPGTGEIGINDITP